MGKPHGADNFQRTITITGINRATTSDTTNELFLYTPEFYSSLTINDAVKGKNTQVVLSVPDGVSSIYPNRTYYGTVEGILDNVQTATPLQEGKLVLLAVGSEERQFLNQLKNGDLIEMYFNISNTLLYDAQWMIGGKQMVVRNGVSLPVNTTFNSTANWNAKNVPRTIMGVKADGTFVQMVIDGREAGGSYGMSMPQVQELLFLLGVRNAMEFDGGGPAQMVARMPDEEEATLQSVPSDAIVRATSNGVLVVDNTNRIPHSVKPGPAIKPNYMDYTPSPTELQPNIAINIEEESLCFSWHTPLTTMNVQLQWRNNETQAWQSIIPQTVTLTDRKVQRAVLPLASLGDNFEYRLTLSNQTWSEVQEMAVPKAEEEFSFIHFSDTFSISGLYDPLNPVLTHLTSLPADFWMMTGNYVKEGIHKDEWDSLFYTGGQALKQKALVSIAGSRDSNYFNYFNGSPDNYYSFDYSSVHFVMLDSSANLSVQATWLDSDLRKTDKPYIIVGLNQSPFSVSRDYAAVRQAFVPIFEKYQVDLILTGDDGVCTVNDSIYEGSHLKGDDMGPIYVCSGSLGDYKGISQTYIWQDTINVRQKPTYSCINVDETGITVCIREYESTWENQTFISKKQRREVGVFGQVTGETIKGYVASNKALSDIKNITMTLSWPEDLAETSLIIWTVEGSNLNISTTFSEGQWVITITSQNSFNVEYGLPLVNFEMPRPIEDSMAKLALEQIVYVDDWQVSYPLAVLQSGELTWQYNQLSCANPYEQYQPELFTPTPQPIRTPSPTTTPINEANNNWGIIPYVIPCVICVGVGIFLWIKLRNGKV